MDQPPRGYALFDLDKTLVPFDTQGLFCNFVLRRQGWRRLYFLLFLPCAPLAFLGIFSLKTMKRIFFSHLWRMPETTLRGYASEFAEMVAGSMIYPEVVAELKQQQAAGRSTVLNSASPDFYVEEIARRLGFDHWVATRMRVADPMPLLPVIDGPNNKREAKIPAMRTLLPEGFDETAGDRLPDSWGFSDSATDVPMLSICENGLMIHPDEKFAAIGAGKGWKTLTPERPYRGKWGGRFASLLQAFGLYRWPESNSPSDRTG